MDEGDDVIHLSSDWVDQIEEEAIEFTHAFIPGVGRLTPDDLDRRAEARKREPLPELPT